VGLRTRPSAVERIRERLASATHHATHASES
jgi:hypothetical protein